MERTGGPVLAQVIDISDLRARRDTAKAATGRKAA